MNLKFWQEVIMRRNFELRTLGAAFDMERSLLLGQSRTGDSWLEESAN